MEAGIEFLAPTLGELARKLGMDPIALKETVEKFNGFARTGIDQDFGHGNSAYDRYYSDPLVRPNPNLVPVTDRRGDQYPTCRVATSTVTG